MSLIGPEAGRGDDAQSEKKKTRLFRASQGEVLQFKTGTENISDPLSTLLEYEIWISIFYGAEM